MRKFKAFFLVLSTIVLLVPTTALATSGPQYHAGHWDPMGKEGAFLYADPYHFQGRVISSGGGDYQIRVRGVDDPSNSYEVYLIEYDPGDYNDDTVGMKIGTGNDDITFDVRNYVDNGAAELYIVIQNASSNDDAEVYYYD